MIEASTSEQQLQTAIIHSLITLNISDQWTRTKVQKDKIQRVDLFKILIIQGEGCIAS